MTPHRRVLVCGIALLGAAGAFGPQAAIAAPIDGGSSFDDAPLLKAGTYTGTILPQETLFYAVALGTGQRLRVDAEVDLSAASKDENGRATGTGRFHLTFQTPLRERLWADYGGDVFGTVGDPVRDSDSRLAPRVLSEASATRRNAMDAETWRGPGIYTFTAAMSGSDGGAVVEFPLRMKLTIDGPSPRQPIGPGPLGAARTAARRVGDNGATSGNEAAAHAVARGAPATVSDSVLAVVAAGTLLLGVGLGRLILRVRRGTG